MIDLVEIPRSDFDPSCQRARTYLSVARAVAHRLLTSARDEGHPHQRDDLYRSMLVFACAGMDRSCKALVEDGFPELAKMDDSVEDYLVGFAKKKITSGDSLNPTVVARLLIDPHSSREALLRDLVADLTGESLQSVQQLFKLCAALRVPDLYVKHHNAQLMKTFAARNVIVHEMDIVPGATDTSKAEVRRSERQGAEYVALANAAFGVALHLIASVSTGIEQRRQAHPFWETIDGGSP